MAAAFVCDKQELALRLNDDASILDAELTAILMAVSHAMREGVGPIIYTDSMAAVRTLANPRRTNNVTVSAIHRAAERMIERPLVYWIPAHCGIEGNEAADALAKAAVFGEDIDRTIPMSKYSARGKMAKTASVMWTEEAYQDASPRTRWHRALLLSDVKRKSLMRMDRVIQRQLFRLRLRSKTYTQMTTGGSISCQHCGEDVDAIPEHWLQECMRMGRHHIQLMALLSPDERQLDGWHLTQAILRRQGEVGHQHLIQLLKRFPLPSPSS